jgi:hypothetical protein
MYGYLRHFKSAAIRMRIEKPDFASKEVPRDTPAILGKSVGLVFYVDANLYHDMLTGRSVTGIMIF